LAKKRLSNQNAEKPQVRQIGSLVNQLMARRGYAQAFAGDDMLRLIVAEVGPEIGNSCQVGKLRAGVLQVYAGDSATLQELNFRRRDVLKRLQKEMPDSKITDVRFRILTS
jgi:predicted nucleic acid-binding Zn ribbon protein